MDQAHIKHMVLNGANQQAGRHANRAIVFSSLVSLFLPW
jgi:hypothetical protein